MGDENLDGMKIVLDYAHFTCLGWTQYQTDVLIQHAGHIHLRQAKSGFLQTKLEEGIKKTYKDFVKK